MLKKNTIAVIVALYSRPDRKLQWDVKMLYTKRVQYILFKFIKAFLCLHVYK
jgi:hypothetical protein